MWKWAWLMKNEHGKKFSTIRNNCLCKFYSSYASSNNLISYCVHLASGSVHISHLVVHSDGYGVCATVIRSSTFPYHKRNTLTAGAHYHLLQEHKPLPPADWYMIYMTFLPSMSKNRFHIFTAAKEFIANSCELHITYQRCKLPDLHSGYDYNTCNLSPFLLRRHHYITMKQSLTLYRKGSCARRVVVYRK